MIAKTPWLERRFESALPLSAFPTVVERLRGTPARVEDRLRGLTAASLTARPDDSWSIQENVGRLIMVEELWAARLDDFEARRGDLRAARFESWRVETARFNDQPVGEMCAVFRRSRETLVRRLEGLEDEDKVLEVIARHPRLDRPMRVVDLVLFIAEHDDHHLARISELVRGTEHRPVASAIAQAAKAARGEPVSTAAPMKSSRQPS